MSSVELCRRIEVPVSRITEMLCGRRTDTSDTALRRGRFFGMSGEFWLNFQQLYELQHAEVRKGAAITHLPSPDDDYWWWARGRHSAITFAAAARKVICECLVRGKRWVTVPSGRRIPRPPNGASMHSEPIPSAADAYHSCPPTVPRPDRTITGYPWRTKDGS